MLCVVFLVFVASLSADCVSGPMPTRTQYARIAKDLGEWSVHLSSPSPHEFALDQCEQYSCAFKTHNEVYFLSCRDKMFDRVELRHDGTDGHFSLYRSGLCRDGLLDFMRCLRKEFEPEAPVHCGPLDSLEDVDIEAVQPVDESTMIGASEAYRLGRHRKTVPVVVLSPPGTQIIDTDGPEGISR